jgi:hypothetical protein
MAVIATTNHHKSAQHHPWSKNNKPHPDTTQATVYESIPQTHFQTPKPNSKTSKYKTQQKNPTPRFGDPPEKTLLFLTKFAPPAKKPKKGTAHSKGSRKTQVLLRMEIFNSTYMRPRYSPCQAPLGNPKTPLPRAFPHLGRFLRILFWFLTLKLEPIFPPKYFAAKQQHKDRI